MGVLKILGQHIGLPLRTFNRRGCQHDSGAGTWMAEAGQRSLSDRVRMDTPVAGGPTKHPPGLYSLTHHYFSQ